MRRFTGVGVALSLAIAVSGWVSAEATVANPAPAGLALGTELPAGTPTGTELPSPIGLTVNLEGSLTGLTQIKDPATGSAYKPILGAGFSVDYFHSIGSFDFELLVQRAMEFSPFSPITNPTGWYTQNPTGLIYLEGDGYYNFKLGTTTLTLGASFQDWIYLSTNAATANVNQMQFEPSVKLDWGLINLKIADNMQPLDNISVVHNPYFQLGLKIGDFSAYLKPDFKFYDFRFNGVKWLVSKGLFDNLSLYTAGILTADATYGFSGAWAYNQFLGLSLAF